jgi:glycosyltransferase involved in cell wall biosynthesis
LKPKNEVVSSEKALKVGTLIRLGAGEAQYKGNALFRELVSRLRASNREIEFYVMGRGTEADGDEWRAIGVTPILNAPDDAKAEYLRTLDVFVSPSMWEGFNLPIVEAQALGTVGIGFDVGAHPETALHLASSMNDAISMIEHWNSDREHLAKACERAYQYVRTQFDWDVTAEGISMHCSVLSIPLPTQNIHNPVNANMSSQPVRGGVLKRAAQLLRREGLHGVRRVLKRLFSQNS